MPSSVPEYRPVKSLTLFLLLLVSSWRLGAQGQTGEIRIEVKDPSGAATEASGRLKNLATGVSQNFQTDAQGTQGFSNLAFGRYQLEISRKGFTTQSLLIDVNSTSPVSQTVTLALGAPAYSVAVVGTAPLPGVDRSLDEIPAPVQAVTDRDIEQSHALDLSQFLNRRLNGVYLNEVQGNPVQPDLNYRGYTASPLLGTPQGVSIYMDGVRLNQPFGDVVSWDLIPLIAVGEVTLIPGSNPLFGLNTLGGALSIQTKDGRTKPGTAISFSGGSFGRLTGDFEHGGSNRHGLNWYLASNLLFEDGWRPTSPSNVRKFFGKLGWQGTRSVLGMTVSYANNSLNGNGLQEQTFLARDYSSVYTKPDVTANRSPLINLNGRHSLNNTVTVSGNIYYRYIRTNTLNGDINEDSLDQSVYQPSAAERAALTAAGYTGFPTAGETAANTPFPFWRCIAQGLLRDEPVEKCNGLINRSNIKQHNYGLSGQVNWFGSPRNHRNQFTAGFAYDRNKVDFLQSTQLGYLNPDRGVTGIPNFADGVTGGDQDGVPFDLRVNLNGKIQTGSVFATDTLTVGRANITVSGRYNRTSVDNLDRLQRIAGPGSLTSSNVFDRFNPAAGITFQASGYLNAYFGYSEGNRAPTSIELGCADPEQPCKLPNAMAGDPPLKQVVTRTFEVGLRGGMESNLRWSIGYFQAENRNDILFVASEQTGFGHFKNFGKTRRQGVEVDVNGRMKRLTIGGGYTFLDATFRSPEEVKGSGNSTNEEAQDGIPGVESTIEIGPGNRIPLIPQHMLKAYTDIQVTSKFLVDLGLVAISSSYARGNENNLHKADGVYYLGPGKSPGYAVANLGARYQLHRYVELFLRITNLFDRKYYTGAQLGPMGFTNTGNFIARPLPAISGEFPVRQSTFFAPGAPIGAWGGIRVRF
jgi:outer membrane receptor protein involved in Fe transport